MANETRNPPIKRKITWLKYNADTILPSMTPSTGNKTTGISAVAASGMASVIHQIAIQIATANVYVTFGLPGSRSPKIIIAAQITGAETMETIRVTRFFFGSDLPVINVLCYFFRIYQFLLILKNRKIISPENRVNLYQNEKNCIFSKFGTDLRVILNENSLSLMKELQNAQPKTKIQLPHFCC